MALEFVSPAGGTLILSGSNTYTGGTAVYGGTLVVDDSSAIPSGTSLIVGGGATFLFDPSETMSVENASAAEGLDPLARSAAGPALDTAVPSAGLATTVPEPGSFVLLLAALVALGLGRYFRQG